MRIQPPRFTTARPSSALTRPSRICTTRSATAAERGSWLDEHGRRAEPRARARRSARRSAAAFCASSSPVGSSAMKSLGRCASAAQIATRCCCPPESSAGSASRRSSRPTRSSSASATLLAPGALDAEQREPERDELARGELGCERARVVLVGVAERARAVLEQRAPAQRAQVVAEHADGARRGTIEPGEDAQQRALAGAARPEDDEELAFRDVERQALQGDRAFPAASRTGGRGRGPRRRSQRPPCGGDGRRCRHGNEGSERSCGEWPVEGERERRQRVLRRRGDGDDRHDERSDDRAGADARRDAEAADDGRAQAARAAAAPPASSPVLRDRRVRRARRAGRRRRSGGARQRQARGRRSQSRAEARSHRVRADRSSARAHAPAERSPRAAAPAGGRESSQSSDGVATPGSRVLAAASQVARSATTTSPSTDGKYRVVATIFPAMTLFSA